ncbi:MAG: trypsin-like peptidase domain-containing protein [Hyphomicrobiales bacterium]|jgi:serine protease Do|nr:trypsin-like peptidase domain-containing protein [Hyphomicrobiales bacterium]
MSDVTPALVPRSVLRRAALLASAAALSVGLLSGLGMTFNVVPGQAIAQSVRSVAGPVSFADVVDQVKPAVVSVRVRSRAEGVSQSGGPGMDALPPGHPLERFFKQFGENGEGRSGGPAGPGGRRGERPVQMSQGSGFFISADGYVVTNNHVVENAIEVQLVSDDGRTLNARLVGTDPRTDLALLKVTEQGSFPFVRLAAATPRIGDWVLAVGNPFGLGGTVTAGILSARNRDIGSGPYDDYLQIDAAVNRGNSGGPAFNAAGEVIGVNTAIVSPSGGSVGIAFAIPAATVEKVVADLKDKGTVSRGFIGVQIQPVTAEIADAIGLKQANGALVADAAADGPAGKAGVRRGDTIIAVNGAAIKDARDLTRRIAGVKPGDKVNVTLWRDGRERAIAIEVGRQPAA